MYVEVITYGGAITNLFVPDKNGTLHDVVCGFDTVKGMSNKVLRFLLWIMSDKAL